MRPGAAGFGGTLPELLFGLRRAGTELVCFRQGSQEEPAVGELALGGLHVLLHLVELPLGLLGSTVCICRYRARREGSRTGVMGEGREEGPARNRNDASQYP